MFGQVLVEGEDLAGLLVLEPGHGYLLKMVGAEAPTERR
jgi:hypothetical protein